MAKKRLRDVKPGDKLIEHNAWLNRRFITTVKRVSPHVVETDDGFTWYVKTGWCTCGHGMLGRNRCTVPTEEQLVAEERAEQTHKLAVIVGNQLCDLQSASAEEVCQARAMLLRMHGTLARWLEKHPPAKKGRKRR